MYSPLDLLPLPEPRYSSYPDDFFYEKVIKHLIPDIVRIMSNGIPIDLDKVKELENTLDSVLLKVQQTIDNSPIIKKFHEYKYPLVYKEFKDLMTSKMRDMSYYLKEFDSSKMDHRKYYMRLFIKDKPDIIVPKDEKWKIAYIKTYSIRYPELRSIIKKTIRPTDELAIKAMEYLAKDKAEIYNKSYKYKISQASTENLIGKFNPGSSDQKRELFEFLNKEALEFSKKTGLPSWGRSQLEDLLKVETDESMKELLQAFIDHSFSAIVKNNFIKAFYEYSIDGVLYGNLKLFGAKSFRLTSNNPNLLNLPSTKSAYAKPVKECLVAPEGFLVLTADYNALEDKVIASLTRDKNKIITQTDKDIDGHLFHATIYFRDKFVDILGDLPHRELTIAAKKARKEGNKEIEELRQLSKGITFGCSYGAYPPKIANQIKCSLEEAKQVFDAYHNEMYPEITKYREEYVSPTAELYKAIHLGMGCILKTDNVSDDIRTIVNATVQFWSILTLLSINKMHHLIDKKGYQNDIYTISTIYDSVYYVVRKDPIIIKWLNDNLIECMDTDFMENQLVKNEAESEISDSWANMISIPNNASIKEIEEVIKQIEERK
jgi:hypothetical protein